MNMTEPNAGRAARRAGVLLAMLIGLGALRAPAAEVDMRDGAERAGGQAGLEVRRFLPQEPLSRARRATAVEAVVENVGEAAAEATVSLVLPQGVRAAAPGESVTVRWEDGGTRELVWSIEADEAREYELRLEVRAGATMLAEQALTMRFLPPLEPRELPYIPEPEPVTTDILVGAHHCPLWEADRPHMWANVRKHPERTPALGFYAQENPEVSDWETKWAVEHGISFFIYCWYRTSQGGPVEMQFGSAIHDALFRSRFADKMKFTIMWENQARGQAGVADERDLMENLLPFWMANYFQHPSYLKLDNKPVLFIYRPEFLIQDLGSVENVVKAFDKMRQACREEGYDGLYLLGEYRGLDPNHLKLMESLGLDYTFAYCWHVPNNPTPDQAIREQMRCIRETQELGILPQVVTVSQAWSGWRDEGSIWKIPPNEYEGLLRQAKDFISTLPEGELGRRLLLLDNWNEWGEGHYIAPYREYGFGYVDAVRRVFSGASEGHVDLIPEDIGRGPYDTAYKEHMAREEAFRTLRRRRVTKSDAPEEGLIAWWAFDEDDDAPVALDYSGSRQGGTLHDARRADGIDGRALVCEGGCVAAENSARLSATSALTIECWVKTEVAGQDNKWVVNRVLAGGTDTGYRLGVLEGKPCFEIPQTSWSHHLVADVALPTGRWVHLAGTFDGTTMRVYVDGELRGAMERPGPVKPNDFHLCLGSYEIGHQAYFTGLLDEVRLYARSLTADEVRAHEQALRR